MTRNMKAELIAKIEEMRTMDSTEIGYAVSMIVDELLSSRVSVRCQVTKSDRCPVPAYKSATDGDYSAFLVANNCD